jgi:hypothetical protein
MRIASTQIRLARWCLASGVGIGDPRLEHKRGPEGVKRLKGCDRDGWPLALGKGRFSLLTIISLGAGVQSTTLALMAARGEIGPRPDCAIFADTQWEPRPVYQHLGWLRSPGVLPFPVHVVTAGNIREAIRRRENTTGGRFAAIPWHTVNPDGSKGLGRRQCSSEYKLEPIMREVRRLLGKGARDRIPPGSVDVLIGISRDEAHRMKPARQAYMLNRYPLVDLGIAAAEPDAFGNECEGLCGV